MFDRYQLEEFEPSACTQLDTVGMQPHSREYLEYEANCLRSTRKFQMFDGQMIDHPDGIHFGDTP